ncbi:hypothetical protein LDENG_00036830 [Lucifuga dentata]|nr:hypothetical protein LDENG_00036830 [Lucifuga dentata]
MSLVCAISNEVPEHPCVSPVSNQVFERRLIEKYIAENGTDPMNGQPLSEEQLIDIKVSHPIRPKAPSATSIPAILKSLQDEWDAVMLHSFTLKQQLQTTRQELSHALYQHDAACRVIARLTKEVTAAREALATLKPQAGLVAPQAVPTSQPAAAGAGEPMEINDQVGMTPEIIQKLQDKATILTTERKKRGKTVPEELVRAEDLSKYRQVASHAGLHSASVPGILALDLCPSDTNKVLTGGADKNVVVFDKNEEQIVATLKGHTKKVTSVIYHPSQSVVFSASPDTTIRVWSVTGGNCVQVVRAHEAGVTGLSLHATGDYLLSSSEDQYWAFSDVQTGRVLTKVTDESAGCALTCAQFHPDGLIFGTGTADSQIKIWDLKERTNVANFPGHSGPVTSIAFSENGYYLATGAQDSSLKLWDLRKLKNFKTITLDNNYEVKSLVFDQSGTYLAVGGSDIRVYICKQWSEVLNFTDHTGLVTGVAFGENAQFLTSAGMDRTEKPARKQAAMGSIFRSEEVCLVQLFLQSGSAYNCVSELGELGLVEFRDLNPNVSAFQRKFVGEVRRCEDLEKTLTFLEQEISRSLSPPLQGPLPPPCPMPSAPQPRELITIEEESERLARELKEVSRNRDSLRAQLTQLCQYRGVLTKTHSLTASQAPPAFESQGLFDNHQDVHLSFVAGVVHPWKVSSFERLLWRACRGYIIVDFKEMEDQLEHPDTGEMVQWTVFLISFWGEQIGQKVRKICDCFRTQTFAYPESTAEREEILQGLQGRIEDIKSVLSQTESFLQQLLMRAVAMLPQWKVRVQKCKAIQMVLNLCSPSVTDKCLIAEAWCPVAKLPALQSALREGGRKSGSGVDSFYNCLPTSTPPPTLFPLNSFTAGFQNIVDAYGVASYREVNPAIFTIITFPFLFAVMFGDVGHGLLMTLAALWMVLEEKDPKLKHNNNEIWRMMFGGRYLILLMGLFSIYTGAIYNECFSRGLSAFSSSWHVDPMFQKNIWNASVLEHNSYLSMDPVVNGVFTSPYPFGIDPIWGMANNKLSFLNSYKMKMSVIIGIIHMNFGVFLSFFNYWHFDQKSSVLLVLIPELFFMMCLFGYLVFMIVYKWIAYTPAQSKIAPSILIHFIDMFLFTENAENPPLYKGQMIVQKVLVFLALCSVPVLLLGKPTYEYVIYNMRRPYVHQGEDRRPLVIDNGSINTHQGGIEGGTTEEEEKEFDVADVFMHQAIHTIEYCLGCISNTASYLRLWALSLAHAQLSEVLWVMVMRIALKWEGYVGSIVLFVIFAFFAALTVAILLVMEGLSAFLHALRLHWVEFQNKFYSGSGYKLNPFSFSALISASAAL